MEEKSKIRCQKPYPQHWMNHSIGRTGLHLASIASLWDSETGTKGPEIRVELTLDDKNSKKYFSILKGQQEEIEDEIGQPHVWHNPEDARSCRIYIRSSTDFRNESAWPEQHEWLRKNLEIFYRVFAPRVKTLNASASSEHEA